MVMSWASTIFQTTILKPSVVIHRERLSALGWRRRGLGLGRFIWHFQSATAR